MTKLGQAVVRSAAPITLVGGGRLGPDDLALARAHGPGVVAVDGGAGAVLAAGLEPMAVIGDMDSLAPEAAVAFADRLHPIAEQETTDFDKALRSVDAPLYLAVGFSGGRFDHELAVLSTLLRHAGRPCVVVGADSVTFLCPPVLEIAAEVGGVFSLYPMVPVAVESQGLRWPTGGILFRPDGMIGTSNAVTGPVRLVAGGPGMLVILPRAELGRVVTALLAGPRWSQGRAAAGGRGPHPW